MTKSKKIIFSVLGLLLIVAIALFIQNERDRQMEAEVNFAVFSAESALPRSYTDLRQYITHGYCYARVPSDTIVYNASTAHGYGADIMVCEREGLPYIKTKLYKDLRRNRIRTHFMSDPKLKEYYEKHEEVFD